MPILGKREPSALQQTLPVTVLYLHTSPVRDAFDFREGHGESRSKFNRSLAYRERQQVSYSMESVDEHRPTEAC